MHKRNHGYIEYSEVNKSFKVVLMTNNRVKDHYLVKTEAAASSAVARWCEKGDFYKNKLHIGQVA